MQIRLYNNNLEKIFEQKDVYLLRIQTNDNILSDTIDNNITGNIEQIIYNVKSFYEYIDTWNTIKRKCVCITL